MITYRRTGGFAGEDTIMTLNEEGVYTINRTISGRKILEKSGRIDASKVTRLFERFEEIGFFSLKENYSPEHRVYDGFIYSLGFTKGDRKKIVTSETETNHPDSFTTILEEVEKILILVSE